ncbi:asparagine synthase (glutamine-hydrolyzing) [Candidatus Pelagibacter bacterium]|nr:asparagine synthase (glutamine-hydrolyzing) [Candidatus Pelagibacter bacterium]
MCGINGFYSKSSSTFNNIIVKMNSAISHRGPNTNGTWLDKNSGIVFGHQRLSIIDLSVAGNQPMRSSSERFILTYNGEIYNYLEIRKELEKNNSHIKWSGNSDTEVLLEAIDFWGIEITLQKIDGMFAFGLWDQKNRSLTLARDRIGEKPLYFGWQGRGDNKVFLFSSELKSLKVHPEFNKEISRDAIALQLRHNCIPAPYSIYRNIYKLLPGHFLQLSQNDLKNSLLPSSKIYWSLAETAIKGCDKQFSLSEKDVQKDLDKNLRLSVKKQMVSDVPLGVFLSGGIDSTTIAALMQLQSNKPIKTFTIGFDEGDYDEAKYAKRIAKHLGTNHTELYISPKKAMEVIPKIPSIYDEPFSDSSQIPTFLVSQLAKQQVKVALSGDGGDELFCGYNRHVISKKFSNIFRLTPLSFRKIFSSGLHSISPQGWNKISKLLPGLNNYSNFGDKIHKFGYALEAKTLHDLYYMLRSHWQNPTEVVIGSKEPGTLLTQFKPKLDMLNAQQQMMVLDALTYLPDDILVKIDRASMASSLETRAPFLDHKLIEYVWKIPHDLKFRKGQGKWILKKILSQYVPSNLIERPKMGFGIPLDAWLRGSLKDWAESLLSEKRLIQENYFNAKLIRDKWEEHLSGKQNWQYLLWNVLMFQAWIEENN